MGMVEDTTDGGRGKLEFVCAECTRTFKNGFGLAIHRSRAHGVLGKFAAQHRGSVHKKRAGGQAEAPAPTGTISEAFEGLAQMMNAHAEIVTQCLDGLDRLLGQAKELRKAYIRNADRLRKIGADVSGFTNNSDKN
jgi:hypothetical protein